MGTSIPPEPRWAPQTSKAEKALWRWAVDQLDDRILVLPQVAITMREKGRPDEAEIDLLLIDPEGGIVVIEVKGGRIRYDAIHAAWRNADAAGATVIRDPVEQAKRARSMVRRLLDKHGVDAHALPLRWAFAAPDCRLEAPGGGVIDQHQLWDDRAADQLARLHAMSVGQVAANERAPGTRTDHIVNVLRGRSVEGRSTLAAQLTTHADEVEALTASTLVCATRAISTGSSWASSATVGPTTRHALPATVTDSASKCSRGSGGSCTACGVRPGTAIAGRQNKTFGMPSNRPLAAHAFPSGRAQVSHWPSASRPRRSISSVTAPPTAPVG